MSSSQTAAHQRVSRPSRKRRRINYFENDSEVDFDESLHSVIDRPLRESRRIRPTYRESSTSSDVSATESVQSDASENDLVVRSADLPSTRRIGSKDVAILPRSRGRPRQATHRKISPGHHGKRLRVLTSNVKAAQGQPKEKMHGTIPPWQTLEHQILVQVFRESREQNPPPNSWVHWILDTCLLCKSFHNASMVALLESPPLMPSSRAKGLLRLLLKDPNLCSMNPRTKVRSLEIDVKNLILKKSGISLDDLITLVSHTPRLTQLRFVHPHDQIHAIWARPGAGGRFWTYPEVLFDRLDEETVLLKGFAWNARFGSTAQVADKMLTMHSRNCLHSIRSLQILNLDLPQKSTDLERSQLANTIVRALQKLEHLESLEFHNCNVADDLLVPHLPVTLKALALFSCGSLTSTSLQMFLSNSASLHSLNLVSNQAMDLAFFSDLSSTAHLLENLHIDMTYRDVSSFQDVSPHFEQSLPFGPPTWPLTLRYLEITNLRSLSLQELDIFLESIVIASRELHQLRKICIKAIPEGAGAWRDRAKLRSKWQEMFARTYDKPSTEQGTRTSATQRRKPRHAAPKRFKDEESTDTSSSEAPYSTHDTVRERDGRNVLWNLTIDGQRPSDLQYKDEDFLDDELSGDEEWKG